MLKKNIKFLALGDIHFGHQSNKTSYILESFRLYFLENHEILKELDYIFLNGDLFEKLLMTNSHEYNLVFLWLINLVEYCEKHNIGLRLLEGTPSHDNEQGKTMYEAIIKMKPNMNFKYIKDIEIEYIEDFGIHVLYVPDKNDKPASERLKIIHKLMKDLNIDKVDLAMMHGNFKYQLPMPSIYMHDEEEYLKIVRFYICINHIHTASVYARILAPGSFDRMAHGEEEDKGALFISIENEDKMMFNFIKNKNARIQKTFYITDKDPEKALNKLHKELSKLPYTSFVRLITKFKLNISKKIKELYDFYHVKEETDNNLKVNTSNIFEINHDVEELNITIDNIIDLLKEEMKLSVKPEEFKYVESVVLDINKNWKM